MLKHLALAILLCLLPSLVLAADDTAVCKPTVPTTPAGPPTPPKKGQKPPKEKKGGEPDLHLLSQVVCEVELALDTYQQSTEVEVDHTLPKLASADFDFKTVVDTKGGFTFNILIFKIGGTVDKQNTNDVDLQYVPKSLVKTALEGARAKSLQEELIDTIKAAAQAVKDQRSNMSTAKDPLEFQQLTVSLAYGVTWDINGGITAPIHLVTIGGTLDRSKNNVQQVKLVFAKPKKEGEEKPKDGI